MTLGVVFAGPSLAAADRKPPSGVALRPPAAAGDLYHAVRAGARAIGLADCVFEDRPTVGHKEILWALSQGVAVIGAASLGALRAVECAPWGMEGIGAVHEICREGGLDDDHRVAVLHAPEALGFAPLTEALVNVSATLDAAVETGALDAAAAAALEDAAEALGFRAAVWPAILDRAGLSAEARRRFEVWLPNGRVDLKRADALALLAHVAARICERPRPPRPEAFPDTLHWRAQRAAFDAAPPSLTRADAGALDELRLDPPRFEAEAVRAYARRAAAKDAGTEEPSHPSTLLETFRAERDLGDADGFEAWLAANGTDAGRLAAALAEEDRLLAGIDRAGPALGPAMLDGLRAEDAFAGFALRAADKARALANAPEPAFNDAALRALLDRFAVERRLALPTEDPDAVARSLGLPDRRALHRLLAREAAYAAQRERG